LTATIESILSTHLPNEDREIIIVDNGSTDETIQIASRFPVTVTKCERRSAAAARNHGAGLAQGQFLAFIDSDVILEPDWPLVLMEALESGFYTAGLGRVIPTGPKSFLNDFRQAQNNWRYERTNISLYHPGGIGPVINSAACIYRKSFFLALGGFDERLQRLEDSELSSRLFAHGGAIYATSRARSHVIYEHGLLRYILRSFKVGRGMYDVRALGKVSRSKSLLDLTKEFFTQDLSGFSFIQKIFFRINFVASYLGFIFSLPVKQLTPRKSLPHLTSKVLSGFALDQGRYRLTQNARFLHVDDRIYFCSVKSGSWQEFETVKIPWKVLEEAGILQRVTPGETN
jgi:glycosyltransferase involved in cell wall biosynthesis